MVDEERLPSVEVLCIPLGECKLPVNHTSYCAEIVVRFLTPQGTCPTWLSCLCQFKLFGRLVLELVECDFKRTC